MLLHPRERVQFNAYKPSRNTVPQGHEGKERACTDLGSNHLNKEEYEARSQ